MAEPRRRLILFTRFPVAGKVKTRLIPALGPEGAAALHRRLTLRTVRTAQSVCESLKVELEIRFAGGNEHDVRHWLGDEWRCRSQSSGDLGQRMAGAMADSFEEGSPATVLIGSDCPALTPKVLAQAFDALTLHPVVFGPATDGGYYLVGLKRMEPQWFQGITWGTETVLEQSLQKAQQTGASPILLPMLDDLDRPEDLAAWRQLAAADEANLSRISVIIPALNEASHLGAAIQSAALGKPHEIVVVDGGSTDATANIAKDSGVKVVRSSPGRARQLNAGAARAVGSVFLFLHADTVLPEDWARIVQNSLEPADVVAGAFSFRIAENFAGRRMVERAANFRSRWFQMPYGDQSLFLRRSRFEELGGFSNLPILEDYELNRRLRRLGRIVISGSHATTSGRRWKKLGVFRTTLTNRIVILGYQLGVRPGTLARLYRHSPACI